ncbi:MULTISPECIES: ABC transporter permease [unclassified Ruegeria]|uniref:ABC transporter permease n=1 Tax=unclassified Ruegeria TaxID=2625375 RepID=UPI001487DE38
MTATVIRTLLSHWRSHRLQLITLLTGIALATGLWSAVQAINTEARASYARASAQLALGQFDEIQNPDGFIPIETYVALRRDGWQVAAVLDGTLRIKGRSVRIMGVDMVSYPALPAVTEAEQSQAPPDPADMLTNPGRLLITSDLSTLFDGVEGFPPVLISTALPPDLVLTDIGVAERLLDRPGQISRLVILPDQPQGRTSLEDLAPKLVRSSPSAQTDTAQLTDSFHLNLAAFGLLSFAVGLFIVHGTVGLAFAQRRGIIRTLRALGVPMRRLIWMILTELVLLALVGGLIGLLIGFFLAGALLPDVAATLRGLYGAPVEGQLSLRPAWVASGLGMAVGGTLAASGHALWKLSQMPLLSGAGLQAWGNAAAHRVMGGVGLLLLVAAGLIYLSAQGLLAGFAMLGALLTGAALLLPLALSALLAVLGRRAKGPISTWVWADMRAQLPGLSLALMALLLALAANIGVGTMVSSFRLTFLGWLDQRLTSELYFSAEDAEQAALITDWLNPQVDAILPIRNTELSHETGPLFLYGVVDDQTYREKWPLIARSLDAWDKVMQGDAILINEQLARRADLWPGDTLHLTPSQSRVIAGVYSDYGNPTGQAIVSMRQLDVLAPDTPPALRFGIRLPEVRAAEMAQKLRDQFDLPTQAVIRQHALKAQSVAIFEKTFVVTSALNVLTLGVAGFAILTSLLTLWTQRLPQVAPVWALGLTRRHLAGLELLRSLLLAALTAILALPLGLILAWVLLAVINVQAFGWRLPMFLFPGDWLRLFALTLVAAALAAALPALRLMRLPPVDLLRVFANER